MTPRLIHMLKLAVQIVQHEGQNYEEPVVEMLQNHGATHREVAWISARITGYARGAAWGYQAAWGEYLHNMLFHPTAELEGRQN